MALALTASFTLWGTAVSADSQNEKGAVNPQATVVITNPALDGFDPNANGAVRAIAVQPDGKIIIGGDFTALAPNGGPSVARNYIARLNVDGTLDTSFDPNVINSNRVLVIVVQPDGKILVGGYFTTLAPNSGPTVTRNHIARLNMDGTLDKAFDPSASDQVFAVALQADGKVLAGGVFDSIGGQERNRFARLVNNTAATQNFSVTRTTVTWTRGGAAPQLARVAFERSTDGVNYTFLGSGTRVGTTNDFALTGQNLPTNRTCTYARAALI